MTSRKKNHIKTVALAAMFASMLAFPPDEASAQTPVVIAVTGSEPATTCISLSRDSKDTDIIVKFAFNEQKNTLTVSLVSYRGIFVFNEAVRYSRIFLFGEMNPKKLPYEIKVPAKGKFKASSAFRKSIKQFSKHNNHREYVFSRWISYDGLQPVPSDYSMINGRIEQAFDIQEQRSMVSITLNDIALLDPCGKEGHFKFVMDKNVNKTFDIALLRDPCYGRQDEITAASQALAAVTAAYNSLKEIYGNGVASSEEARQFFNSTKDMVSKQFTKVSTDSNCDCIRESREKYNACIDSIIAMNYKTAAASRPVVAPKGINADQMLTRARKIDSYVGKWLNSSDPVERRDLEKKCESLISAAKSEIASRGVYTSEQKEARNVMERAERYYRNTCKK